MLRWIDVEQLRVGMFVCELGGSWIAHPFWRSKMLISSREDVRKLVDGGIKSVCIDLTKGIDVEATPPPETAHLNIPQPPTPIREVSIAAEQERAARICASGKKAVTSMFHEARMGNAIDVSGIAPLVDEISASISRNSGALISLARLKTKDDYTYMHSVAVCALMIALARQMQLSEQQTRSAGLAGLLHDMGKATTPPHILNKPGKLTDAEFAVMRQHPAAGHAILIASNCNDAIALDVCLHHHEQIDGSGYPHGLHSADLSLYARMSAVCDVYDAVTSERPYNKGWDPAEAVKKMAEWQGHFDPHIFQFFVKSLGIYPIGSLLRLESGRLAVVIEQSKKSPTMPKVKVFFSTIANCHLMPEIIDLSRPQCAEHIVGGEAAEKWNLGNIDELWNSATASNKPH